MTVILSTTAGPTKVSWKQAQSATIDTTFRSLWRQPDQVRVFLMDKTLMDELSLKAPTALQGFWDFAGLDPSLSHRQMGISPELSQELSLCLLGSPLVAEQIPLSKLIALVSQPKWITDTYKYVPLIRTMSENEVLVQKLWHPRSPHLYEDEGFIVPPIEALEYLVDPPKPANMKTLLRSALSGVYLTQERLFSLVFHSKSLSLMDGLLLYSSPKVLNRASLSRLLQAVASGTLKSATKMDRTTLLRILSYDDRLVDWSSGETLTRQELLSFKDFETLVRGWTELDSAVAKRIVEFLIRQEGRIELKLKGSLDSVYDKLAVFPDAMDAFHLSAKLSEKLSPNTISAAFQRLCSEASAATSEIGTITKAAKRSLYSLHIFLINFDLASRLPSETIAQVVDQQTEIASADVQKLLLTEPAFVKRLSGSPKYSALVGLAAEWAKESKADANTDEVTEEYNKDLTSIQAISKSAYKHQKTLDSELVRMNSRRPLLERWPPLRLFHVDQVPHVHA